MHGDLRSFPQTSPLDTAERRLMFKLEITTLAEFLTFVHIIRNKECNIEELKQLTTQLNQSNDALTAAIAQQQP